MAPCKNSKKTPSYPFSHSYQKHPLSQLNQRVWASKKKTFFAYSQLYTILAVKDSYTGECRIFREDWNLIGAVGKENKFLKYFFPNFNKLRIKNKIKWKILYDAEVKGKKITKLPLMETKFLPKEYSSPAVINIYGDKVVNVLWKGDNPVCFMIINKEIADSYRKWFKLLWKTAKS